VSEPELSNFQITQTLTETHDFRLLAAADSSGASVWLTVFSADVSRRPEFRRALKMDRTMLMMLHHQSIIRFLGTGETDGTLFFWTAASDYLPLSQQLSNGRTFSVDDVIEIGWQLCSALQHAHNLGLAYGGLTTETVMLSDNLQVLLTGFGIQRWLTIVQESKSASSITPATISALAGREQIERDLKDLAWLLSHLLTSASRDDTTLPRMAVGSRSMLERLLARCLNGSAGQLPQTAREFQGRLGELLIGSDEDQMPLVDQRDQGRRFKQSIVMELFEPDRSATAAIPPGDVSAGSATWKQFLPIVLVVTALVILTLIAAVAL
jgi:serine/threonine protein kinase